MGMQLPAGWYGDPADTGRYRWWDGDQWTAHTRDKAEVDRAAAAAVAASRPLPDFDALPPDVDPTVHDDEPGRRRGPIVVLAVALLAVLAAAGVVTFGRSEASGHRLTGEVRVPMAAVAGGARQGEGFGGDGASCGAGGGRGIGVGTPVTVRSARDQELGATELGEGRVDRTLASVSCVFTYAVDGVGDAGVYVVRVGNRRGVRASRADVEAAQWQLDVQLD